MCECWGMFAAALELSMTAEEGREVVMQTSPGQA